MRRKPMKKCIIKKIQVGYTKKEAKKLCKKEVR